MAHDPIASLRIRPGKPLHLADLDTRTTLGWEKEAAIAELTEVKAKIDVLQQRLFAEERRSLLLVLQAMDAAGKDGTIRNILAGLNPAGFRISSFGVPGGPETQHDYLWRVHAEVPRKGVIGIFNRSHYEDVLVPPVSGWITPAQTAQRYAQINDFERMLTETGTVICKFLLHISKDEQRQRLQERLDDPTKNWKFALGDLEVRKQWDAYQRAYSDAIAATGTTWAPWTIVPADSKTHRDLMIATVMKQVLQGLKLRYPPTDPALKNIKVV